MENEQTTGPGFWFGYFLGIFTGFFVAAFFLVPGGLR